MVLSLDEGFGRIVAEDLGGGEGLESGAVGGAGWGGCL